MPVLTDLRPALREHFGFDEFRPGQEDVVRAALDGRDTLALMPTGAGKSLTYQLAAMLRPSPTLVLSPLIALMKDQVDKLPPQIAATATFVNSSLAPEEASSRLASVASGDTRLLYAAPERLRQQGFVETLRRIGVGLVVIDEVHCVSMWGHDFRPDYLFIRRALDVLDEPAVLGMTATATPANASAIAEALGRSFEVVRTSVHRPNLRYDVERAENGEERLRALLRRLRGLDGAAIVYARSRRSCEEIARMLVGHGVRAEHYHAGLEADERTRVQEAFVSGRTPVVVATTAFGMGIDKADVRLVALVNFPDSLESYVQMVGRAGRDGAPSDTVLLAGDADASALRRFALRDVPTPDLLRRVYRVLRDSGGTVDPESVAAATEDSHDPRVLVGMLEQAGIVRRGYDAGRAMRVELLPVEEGAGAVVDGLLDRLAHEAAARVERIVSFAETSRCRHLQVAEHFDETLATPCGACDVCAPRAAAPETRRRRAASPRRSRGGDRRRRSGADLAPRATQPRGASPWLREGASERATLSGLWRPCRGVGRTGDPLGACARGGGGARRGRVRRVPRPPGTVFGAIAVARAAAGGSSVRAARRRASRLAHEPRPRGRCPGVRRPARCDARRAGGPAPALDG